jgi:archaellum component FlaC
MAKNLKLDPQAPATNQTVMDAADHILKSVQGMVDEVAKELTQVVERANTQVRGDIQDIKRDINDLKADTPTQKEFDELKAKVERHHPIN